MASCDLAPGRRIKDFPVPDFDPTDSSETASIVLAGGCFWCVEAVFQRLNGVENVVSGYMGGKIKDPTYREVSSGLTGHAEVIQIEYDPKLIKYVDLLDVFWVTHNPTTLNQQGADKGTQYRSAIFYHDEDQKLAAALSKSQVATTYWTDPIVTEITEASIFYPAEKYHQNYYNQNGTAPYCRVVIDPKIDKLKAKFINKLKKEYV